MLLNKDCVKRDKYFDMCREFESYTKLLLCRVSTNVGTHLLNSVRQEINISHRSHVLIFMVW
jgi:hypothetical protein